MRSMTGFGVGDAPFAPREGGVSGGKITIEIRAVNHRYLDIRVRVPSQLPDLAGTVELIARERLTRGRFDIAVRVDGAALGAVSIDIDRVRAVFRALEGIRNEFAPSAEVPLSVLAAVPHIFVPSIEKQTEEVRTALTAAFDAAHKSLDGMRDREGASLGEDLLRRLARVCELSGTVSARGPLMLDAYKKRLKDRAERLRLVSDVEVDAGRLEQEITLFADRVDVAEELTRLASHAAHFETLLEQKTAVGRRLDFLLQEMAREANTIGSKSQDVEIAHAVVELKAEVDRMREQVQNIE